MKRFLSLVLVLALILALAGCGAGTAAPTQPETTPAPSAEPTEDSLESTASTVTSEPVQTGLFAEQIFSGADGDIHYSYYLPDSYAGSRKFPMMVVISNLPKKLLLERKRVSSIFQEEIDEEQQRINEAERLIKELDEKTKSQEEE